MNLTKSKHAMHRGTPKALVETLQGIDGTNAYTLAKNLYIDPSTVRYRLNVLERITGKKLYHRASAWGRGAKLTDAGRELIAENEELLS